MRLLRLARVGPHFAIVERFGDRERNRPPEFAMYRIAEQRGGAFKIDPERMIFVMQRKDFDGPYHLQLIEHPSGWWDEGHDGGAPSA